MSNLRNNIDLFYHILFLILVSLGLVSSIYIKNIELTITMFMSICVYNILILIQDEVNIKILFIFDIIFIIIILLSFILL